MSLSADSPIDCERPLLSEMIMVMVMVMVMVTGSMPLLVPLVRVVTATLCCYHVP